jgi:hypothetical protein
MLFYSHTITPRLEYISNFIGKEIAGEAFRLTTDIELFKNYDGPRLNYSSMRILPEEVWIIPHPLLGEKGVQKQRIDCFKINGITSFFKTEDDLGFDIFSASFYLLSRYEEYLPHQKDMYGRYAHENSLAFNEKFLDIPLVNKWIEELKKKLKEKFPTFNTSNSIFNFIPTYDIDEAYSYKHKGTVRTTGAVVKSILKGQLAKIGERRRVLKGELQDPYDSYQWMDELHRQYQLKPHYFFLLPGKTGKYDRNILPSEQALQQLVKQHAGKYETGIHPSWQSGDHASLMRSEIATLESITGKKVYSSRQHFIRLTLPHTFRQLIDAGIDKDFSMGYGSINGFRASVASPFYWYDLEKEKTTGLLLYPFCYMEANSFFEQKFSASQAFEEMMHYHREVKAVNGTLITLWHNTFLGTDPLFKGWREAYEAFIGQVAIRMSNG